MSGDDDGQQWVEIFDEASQRPYYANLKTGLTTWDKPAAASVTSPHQLDDKDDDDDGGALDDNKPVLYTSGSGQYAVAAQPPRQPHKSRIATTVLEGAERGPAEALDEPAVLAPASGAADDPFDDVAIADLDLNEADQFQFSDDDDDDDNSSKASSLSVKDARLMRGDSSRRLQRVRTHSRQTSLLSGPARRPHRRHASDATDAAAAAANSPGHEYGSKLKVLDGNAWDGIQISTIPLPCWPRPAPETCRQEAALYRLPDYVAAHCSAPKSWFGSGSGAVADPDTVLRHTTGKLKAPLSKDLASLADGAGTAAQMLKNVQSFMQDRKSSKDWFGHASRIVKVGLASDEAVRNEIYLLLVKQLRGNPNPISADLGWRLMLICSGVFGPSEELACYLRSFFFDQVLALSATDTAEPSPIEQAVVACIHSLQMTMARGPRRERPLQSELQCTRDLKPSVVRVQLLHGESVQVAIHPQTTVDDVLALCCDFFDTDRDEGLALFETLLDGKGGRVFLPLDPGERILDLITVRPARSQAILKSAGADDHGGDQRQLQFVFRVRMFKAETLSEPRLRGGTRSLIFVEVVDSVLYGCHRLTSTDGVVLAALLVQSCFDCRHADLADLIRAKLDRILPARLRGDVTESELVAQIEAQIQMRGGVMTTAKARRLFLDEVQHMTTFAANFFHVVRLTTTKKGHVETQALVMAISWRGLLLLDPVQYDIVQGITINELLTYGQKDGKILMVIGTSIRHENVMFSSWQAAHIDRAIRLCCRQSPAIMALGAGPAPPP